MSTTTLVPSPAPPPGRRSPVGRWLAALIADPHVDSAARRVARRLADLAVPATGVIQDHRQPSITGLARATGLRRDRTVEALRTLERAGWLVRRRPGVGTDARFRLGRLDKPIP